MLTKSNSSLFRFSSINKNTLGSLIGNYLYFSTPYEFNDPFDSMLNLFVEGNNEDWNAYFKRIGKEHLDDNEKSAIISNINNFGNSLNVGADTGVYNESRVACFTKNFKSILMWSHYASDHTGICIEYKTIEISDENDFDKFNACHMFEFLEDDMNYVTITELNPNQICALPMEYEIDLPGPENFINPDPLRYKKFIFTKHIDWKYENEYRIFLYSESMHGKRIARLKPHSISNIYFGMRTTENDINTVMEIIKASQYYSSVGFYKMNPLSGKYAVEPIKIQT